LAAAHAIHLPLPTVVALSAQATPSGSLGETIHQALQTFAGLGEDLRLEIVRSFWNASVRRPAWRRLLVSDAAWRLARDVRSGGSWSVEQIVVAACDWFVTQRW